MNGLRKFIVFILTPILFLSLIGLAASTSSNINLRDPSKIEGWLEESNLYDHFVKNATKQAEDSKDSGQNAGVVDLTDQAVQNAAQESFTADQIKQNVNTFIEANYAWLEGKTEKPKFEIDLTEAKMTFADKVAQYAVKYTAGLPVCTNDQAAAAQTSDPLSATCRPSNVTPEQVGETVHQQIMNGSFLGNSVVTADNINPDNNAKAQPYYKKLSMLPQVYQMSAYAPYAFGGIALLSVLGIIFLASKRRGGLKITAWTALIAGIILILNKFATQYAYDQLEPRIFNDNVIGEVQKSLSTFFNLVETALNKTEMYFGIAYVVLALIIFISLLATRKKSAKKPKNKSAATPPANPAASQQNNAASRIAPRSTDVPNSGSHASGTPDLPYKRPASTAPKKPKKPRLIQ